MPAKTPAPEPAADPVELSLLEATADQRLFILCGCGHAAAFHSDAGCKRVIPAKIKTAGYSSGPSESTPETACTCPTPREIVYLSGRQPESVTA
jgi:hypothetical protein